MALEALALECRNDRHIEDNCGCQRYMTFVQVWMAKLYHFVD